MQENFITREERRQLLKEVMGVEIEKFEMYLWGFLNLL